MVTEARLSDVNIWNQVAGIPGNNHAKGETMDISWLVYTLVKAAWLQETGEALWVAIICNIKMNIHVTNDENIFLGQSISGKESGPLIIKEASIPELIHLRCW